MRKFLTMVVLASLAACAAPRSAPPPPSVARPAPLPPPPAPVAQDWQDLPLTTGVWVYVADAAGSSAMFGRAGAEADFIVRCDFASRSIVFSRSGGAAPGATLTLTTSAGSRSYPAAAFDGPAARIGARTPASDAFLDWVAFSRGRFTVAAAGVSQLVLPAWPEPARAIEDCRK